MRPSHPHDESLPRDPEAVKSEKLATILSRSGLFSVPGSRLLATENPRETAIRVAGGDLQASARFSAEARTALEGTLTPEQRALYLDLDDAQRDAAGDREGIVETVARAHGLIVGLTLSGSPDYEGAQVARFGAALASALLASDLPADDLLWTAYGVVGHLLEIVQPGALHGRGENREEMIELGGEPEAE